MSLTIYPRVDSTQGCTKQTCDASRSVYGYVPSLAATILFLILFALSGILHTWQGIRRKTWFFGSAMVIGCIGEVLGYAAKLMLWNNPFSSAGFKLSLVVLTFAPAFYSAGIYYTLKHIAIAFGSSRLRPSLYTWIFITCDIFSIFLQGIGGGVASTQKNDSTLEAGDNIIITGLATQVFTLLVFGLCAADYAVAVRRNKHRSAESARLRDATRFQGFLAALTIAYLMILMRCAYRVAELSKGWGSQNYILHNQWLFIGLDSIPCAIATIVLNIWHPGWCFPRQVEEKA